MSTTSATSATDLVVRFPAADGSPSQDREWCEVVTDGETRTIRFHDYGTIYSIPGLYERIFYEHLECSSPTEVVGLLAEQLRAAGDDPASLSVLDVGAGNGLVGEELRRAGARAVVGLDILPEAAEAAARDRPEVYDDYVVCDLTRLDADERRRLCDQRPNALSVVAALGFADIPPAAFAQAWNLVEDDGWVAFNIKADFLDVEDESGFRRLVVRMLDDGVLEESARRRYCHRLSMQGEPLEYVAVVGRKRADVPAAWLG